MSAEKIGLYWASCINESPKYKYDKHYGVLVMMPFILSWIGFLSLPVLLCTKKKKILAFYNNIFFFIGYSFLCPFLISIFMAVNLMLLPLAYIKTIVHKVELIRAYQGKDQVYNMISFFLIGIPILVVA